MGVTRVLAPVLIRQFLHSYWSRATAETAVPHRATRTSSPYKELFTWEPYHFIAGGVLCWKKSLKKYNFCIYFTFWPRSVDAVWPKSYLWMGIKLCWIGFQLWFKLAEAWFLIIYLDFVSVKLSSPGLGADLKGHLWMGIKE